MKLSAIKKLIKNGASETLEFKTSTAQLKRAFETICGFLNGEGGTVLIGVDDQGKIVGQNVTDKTRRKIALELDKLEPTPKIDVEYIPLEGGGPCVIHIKTLKSPRAPYLYDRRAYQRLQSTTVKMSKQWYDHLLLSNTSLNYSWEKLLAADYKITDLDHEEIHRTVSAGIRKDRIPAVAHQEDIEALLHRLSLISPDGVLKQAAVVLYAHQKAPKLLQCTLEIARFSGKDNRSNCIDNKQMTDHTFYLLEEANTFLKRHLLLKNSFKLDELKPTDKPVLPLLAVREALINAICHCDYDSDRHITLTIFDDRVEIWNSGTLPEGLQLTDLKKKHTSFPRNPLIANALYSFGFCEGWGTGTNKMIDLCVEEKVPRPTFKEQTKGLLVTFRFKVPFGSTAPADHLNKKTISERQQQILSIIRKHASVHYQTIQAELAKPVAFRTIQKDLNELKDMRLVQLVGYGRSLNDH